MIEIQTDYLKRCLLTLEKSYAMLQQSEQDSLDYDLFRNALVKSFEITLEQSGKLLKRKLLPYLSSKKSLDRLTFKDLFRAAHHHDLLNENAVERWFAYRDNRNNTAHDYGVSFAEDTLNLIDTFITDVRELIRVINHE